MVYWLALRVFLGKIVLHIHKDPIFFPTIFQMKVKVQSFLTLNQRILHGSEGNSDGSDPYGIQTCNATKNGHSWYQGKRLLIWNSKWFFHSKPDSDFWLSQVNRPSFFPHKSVSNPRSIQPLYFLLWQRGLLSPHIRKAPRKNHEIWHPLARPGPQHWEHF